MIRMSLFSLLHASSIYIGSIRQSNAQKIVKSSRIMDDFGENQPHVGLVFLFCLYDYFLLCDIRRELLTGGDLVLSTKYK